MNEQILRKTFLSILLTLLSSTIIAQIPAGYYDSAEGKTGDALKVALHNIIKGHHDIGYSGLWDAFPYTDVTSEGNVWDIYSSCVFSYSGNKQCGTYSIEGDCYNREHTWPQSWFNEQSTPKCDLFHVYPTDGKVNGVRSNYPYGEVGKVDYTSSNGSKLGTCKTAGYSGKVFEPIKEYKGDIARGFFYMSVRYYSEDSGWGSSDMTNKSVIKDWAMKMLLRWSDEDPVSQKEIDRNNTIYNGWWLNSKKVSQGNRNPFIDHPEYARMIWDPNWTPAPSYNITCATNLQHGSVSAPASANEGSTVSITATPAIGYAVDTYSAWKTNDTSTTVNVSNTGTFTMPGYPVTVSATFKENNTYYNIAVQQTSNGTITASATSALPGTTVTLIVTPDSGYELTTIHVFKTGNTDVVLNVENNQFVMPDYNVTVAATFAQPGALSDYAYEKITAAPSDWSGQYLIVYEGGNVAFDGGMATLDATNNSINVTISNNTIAANSTTDAASFTIATMTGGYSIKSASGKYIGSDKTSNGITTSENALVNTITYSNNSTNIKGTSGNSLLFNTASDQQRFRYFGSSQKAIQLYKKVGEAATVTHTITFHNGTVTKPQIVEDFKETTLEANTFTKTGYVFDGWNTKEDGTGDYYADEATVKLLADLDLYAQWDQLYNITCNVSGQGRIVADHTEATEGTPITLTAYPSEGYVLHCWKVTDYFGDPIDVVENEFEMPACNVTVDAWWRPASLELGDANGDGSVTISDAVVVVNSLLGQTSEGFIKETADVNCDGNVTISDAIAIVNLILHSL